MTMTAEQLEERVELITKTLEESNLFARLDQVEEDLSVKGSEANDTLEKIDAVNARITASEKSMTNWVEVQIKVARDLIQTETDARRDHILAVGRGIEQINERVRLIEDGPLDSMMLALGDLQAAVGRLEKSALNIGETLGQTEQSQDRRRINAKQNAKGEWQLDCTVEFYGSDAHVVAQELANLIAEARREMAKPTGEGWRVELEEPDHDPREAAF